MPCILSPAENHRKVEAPIVMLANLYSASMSEMTSMAVKRLPNGCIVGDGRSALRDRCSDITRLHTTVHGSLLSCG